MGNRLSRLALCLAVLVSSVSADDTSITVSPSWASVTIPEAIVMRATVDDLPFTPDWSTPAGVFLPLGPPVVLEDGSAAIGGHTAGEDVVTASDPDLTLDDGDATIRVLPPASLLITSARFRDHENPTKRRLDVRGFLHSGVVSNTFEEEGDELWPFAFEESETSTMWANGVSSGAIVELPNKGKARRFRSVQGELSIKLVPTSAPSLFRFSLRWRSSIPELDPDGEVELVFEHGAFLNATGSVTLEDGRFAARKQPAALGAPDLAVLAGRARVADGAASDRMKLVLVTTPIAGDPDTPRDVRVCLSDTLCFEVLAEDFTATNGRWRFASKAPGVRRVVVDTRRQRITFLVKGGELGDWPSSGTVISTLQLDIGDRARKVGTIVGADGDMLSF